MAGAETHHWWRLKMMLKSQPLHTDAESNLRDRVSGDVERIELLLCQAKGTTVGSYTWKPCIPIQTDFFFFFFWLLRVFIAAHWLSLVAASGGYSSLWCAGFSLRWLLLLRSTGSRHVGSVVVAHGPLHWQADCWPLRHQRSPQPGFDEGFYNSGSRVGLLTRLACTHGLHSLNPASGLLILMSFSGPLYSCLRRFLGCSSLD